MARAANQFVPIMVDCNQWRQVVGKYGVRLIPDVRMLDSTGAALDQFIGLEPAAAVAKRLNAALEATN